MKINTQDNFVLSNTNNSKAFTINATAKAFKILSSALYSDKVEAIIRELSCNAYDSHVDAGKLDVPFKVHLPTEWDPVFSVEDFGIGLDKEGVEKIYTSYFTSTKTESNDLIGGLGLGSKTPFSYTDAFNLISRKNGKEYSYTAYIDASGQPAVSLLSETDTTEPNGVKVVVPVNEKDFREFKTVAARVYAYFRVKPQMNIEIDLEKVDFESLDSLGYIFDKHGRSNTVKVIMGNVLYRVNNVSNTFANKLSQKALSLISRVCLTAKFNIGDLDVAASRETLSFDEPTEKAFVDKIEEITNRFYSDLQVEVDKHDCIASAYIKVSQSAGKWAIKHLNFKDEQDVEHTMESHVFNFILEILDEHYKKLFVPKPMLDSKGAPLLSVVSNKPVMSSFERSDYMYEKIFTKSGSKVEERSSTRYNMPTSATLLDSFNGRGNNIYFALGDDAGFTKHANYISCYFQEKYQNFNGRYIVLRNLNIPDVVYEKLTKWIGATQAKNIVRTVITKDAMQKGIAEKKAKLAAARALRLADPNYTKKTRIKKTQIRLDNVHFFKNGKFVSSQNKVEVELESYLKDKKFMVLEGAANKICSYEQRVSGYKTNITNSYVEMMALMLPDIDMVISVHNSNAKGLEAVKKLKPTYTMNDVNKNLAIANDAVKSGTASFRQSAMLFYLYARSSYYIDTVMSYCLELLSKGENEKNTYDYELLKYLKTNPDQLSNYLYVKGVKEHHDSLVALGLTLKTKPLCIERPSFVSRDTTLAVSLKFEEYESHSTMNKIENQFESSDYVLQCIHGKKAKSEYLKMRQKLTAKSVFSRCKNS